MTPVAAPAQPSPPQLSAAYAWQLLALHRPAPALELTAQLLTHDPANLPALLARTEALRQLGQLPAATEAAHQAVAQAPQSGAAFYALAQLHGQEENFYSARSAALEAVRLSPADADYLGLLAYVQYELADLPAAIVAAESGLSFAPQHPTCLLWLLLAYEDSHRFSEADALLPLLLQASPDDYAAQANAGYFLLRRAEPTAAATHLLDALRLAPNHSSLLLPALAQARRYQSWPAWLVRWGVRTTAARRPALAAWGLRRLLWPLAAGYTARSWIVLRRDPALMAYTRHERAQRRARLRYPWASTPIAWVALLGFLIGFVCVCTFVVHVRTGPAFLGLYLVARYFMKAEKEA